MDRGLGSLTRLNSSATRISLTVPETVLWDSKYALAKNLRENVEQLMEGMVMIKTDVWIVALKRWLNLIEEERREEETCLSVLHIERGGGDSPYVRKKRMLRDSCTQHTTKRCE
jgi:hypothetical protein